MKDGSVNRGESSERGGPPNVSVREEAEAGWRRGYAGSPEEAAWRKAGEWAGERFTELNL